jgi:hypothetical protein
VAECLWWIGLEHCAASCSGVHGLCRHSGAAQLHVRIRFANFFIQPANRLIQMHVQSFVNIFCNDGLNHLLIPSLQPCPRWQQAARFVSVHMHTYQPRLAGGIESAGLQVFERDACPALCEWTTIDNLNTCVGSSLYHDCPTADQEYDSNCMYVHGQSP